MSRNAPDSWKLNYYQRIMDLIDQHAPDLLYTDGGIPYGDLGYNILAHLYNTSAARNNGAVAAIYTSKSRSDAAAGICVLDRERGVENTISAARGRRIHVFGNWHYDKRVYNRDGYKTPKFVRGPARRYCQSQRKSDAQHPVPNNGMPDDKELKVIDGITQWMAVNGEGIHGTRPYKIVGKVRGWFRPHNRPARDSRNRPDAR